MAPKSSVVFYVRNENIKENIHIEPHIDLDAIDQENGIIGKAIHNAQLVTFFTRSNKFIYPVPIVEFFGNLDESNLQTSVSTSTSNPNIRHSYSICLLDAAEALNLRNDGADVESAGSNDATKDLRLFSISETEEFDKQISSKALKAPFKKLCHICTRIILSHIGSHTTVSRIKLKVMCALMDEIKGIKYNWAKFIVKQWVECAKEVNPKDRFSFTFQSHVRYSNVLTSALSKIARRRVRTLLIEVTLGRIRRSRC